MFLIYIITFILLINPFNAQEGIGDDYFKISKLTNSTGIYYEHVGNIKLYNNRWTLLITSNIQQYKIQFKYIQSFVSQIHIICDHLKSNEIEPTVCNMFSSQINLTLSNLKVQNSLIDNLLGVSSHNNRERRGLIDAVGNIAKQLFGTLDNTDAIYYDKQLKLLNENQNHIKNLFREQTTVYESNLESYNNTVKTWNQIDQWKGKLQEIIETINNQTSAIKLQNFFNDSTQKLSEMFSIFVILCEQYSTLQSHIIVMITSAMQGHLHPYIISSSELLNELLKFQAILEGDLHLPIPPTFSKINLYYKIIQIHAYFMQGKLNLILYIPLTSSRSYEIYKMTSIPKRINDSNFVFISLEKPFLIFDTLKQFYFLYNENEFDKCQRSFENNYICEQSTALSYIHNNGGCEIKLFLPSNSIPDSCQKHIVSTKQILFLELAAENSWIFIAPTNETVTINCQDYTKSITITDVGILQLRPRCQALSSSLILSSIGSFKGNVSLNYISYINAINLKEIEFDFNSSTSTFINYKAQSLDISNQINMLNKMSTHIKLLKHELNVPIKSIDHHFHFYTIYTILVLIIITIVIFCFYQYCILRINKKSSKLEQNIAESTLGNNVDVELDSISTPEPQTSKNQTCTTNPRYKFES